jgi:hypothetical protein
VDFQIFGPVVTGIALGGIYRFPQAATIARIDAFARVAPSTGPFTAWLTVDGSQEENISIVAGQDSAASGTSITVPAGAVVRLNVTSAGDASDITVSAFYAPNGGN